MFREGQHLSTWHRFGLHFGSVLGAQVDTKLLFGRPGVQIGCPEAVGWEGVFCGAQGAKMVHFGWSLQRGENQPLIPDGLAREGNHLVA